MPYGNELTGERSFTKLKLIKDEVRATVKQGRLDMLSLMSIKRVILRELNFEDIIKDFSNVKARKVTF